MQHAEKQLHPDQAAQQAFRVDERQAEELDAANTQDGGGSGKTGAPVSQRAGKRQNELPVP